MSEQQTWPQIIEQSKEQFELIATASNLVTWAEQSQFAIQAINKNERLAQCVPASIQDAVINVAAIGLTLNPAFGYAYLVPEATKVGNTYINLCQLRVSFKGLMKIATDSGSIDFVKAEIVKESDSFTYNGPCAMPVHQMNPFGDRGKTVGVYCIAKTKTGDVLVDIMGMDEINKCKGAAKTKYVWDSWFEEMAKKAIIKRASKQWPAGDSSDRLHQAIDAINETEGSQPLGEVDITPKPEALPQKQLITDARLESAIEKIKGGEYSVEKLSQHFNLNEDQKKIIEDAGL